MPRTRTPASPSIFLGLWALAGLACGGSDGNGTRDAALASLDASDVDVLSMKDAAPPPGGPDAPASQGGVLQHLPSADTMYGWIEALTQHPHRRAGSEHDQAAERWIADRFRAIGLENVRSDAIPTTYWNPGQPRLMVDSDGNDTLDLEIPSHWILNTNFTGPDGVTAQLTWKNEGNALQMLTGTRGRIVVVESRPTPGSTGKVNYAAESLFVSDPQNELRPDHLRFSFFGNLVGFMFGEEASGLIGGAVDFLDAYANAAEDQAAALVMVADDYPYDSDKLYFPYDAVTDPAKKPIPGLLVRRSEYARLKALAEAGRKAQVVLPGARVASTMANVWGVLPGMSDQAIIVTTHHDSPWKGAFEDGSGLAQVLAQATAWAAVPRAQRPFTMVFVATAGHMYGVLGAKRFALDNAALMARTRLVLNLEHITGREVQPNAQGGLTFTGLPEPTMWSASEGARDVVKRAMEMEKPRASVLTKATRPYTDLDGYLVTPDRKFEWVSSNGVPLYLLDDQDTLDKIDRERLVPTARFVTRLLLQFMERP